MAWLPKNNLWQCTECGIRSAKSPFLGEPSKKCFWHDGAASRADRSHKMWVSRLLESSVPLAWCGSCGCYAMGRMVGLGKPCKGTMLLSHSRLSLNVCRHPVTREVLGKPVRYRHRSCWKDRLRRWRESDLPLSSGHSHGLPIASQSAFFDSEQEPEVDTEQGAMDEDMTFLDDVWGPFSGH